MVRYTKDIPPPFTWIQTLQNFKLSNTIHEPIRFHESQSIGLSRFLSGTKVIFTFHSTVVAAWMPAEIVSDQVPTDFNSEDQVQEWKCKLLE